MGLWLPVALANIHTVLVALLRQWAGKDSGIKVLKLSETLESWCLPILSRAFKTAEDEAEAKAEADRKEREALALFNMVKKLETEYGQ